MKRYSRYVLLGFAWLFLAAIVAQVYFAGLMLFGHEGGRDLHEENGYMLGTAAVLFVALTALARAGSRTIVLGVVLALITFFQPTLTFARDQWPLIAAFHPVNALAIFTLSVVMIRRATQLVREQRVPTEPTVVIPA
jgi:hypothetical protein